MIKSEKCYELFTYQTRVVVCMCWRLQIPPAEYVYVRVYWGSQTPPAKHMANENRIIWRKIKSAPPSQKCLRLPTSIYLSTSQNFGHPQKVTV